MPDSIKKKNNNQFFSGVYFEDMSSNNTKAARNKGKYLWDDYLFCQLAQKKETDNFTNLIKEEKELIEYVKLAERKNARVLLSILLEHKYSNFKNISIVKFRTLHLITLLTKTAIEIGIDIDVILEFKNIYIEDIKSISDFIILSERFKLIVERFIELGFIIKNVKNKDIILKAISYIRANYNNDITLAAVASKVCLSQYYFSRLFKKEMELSYTEYLNKTKIDQAKKLLLKNIPHVEIALKVGFSNQSYFITVFKNIEKLTPKNWQNNHI